ncbi:hypothetical protein RND71_025391 [Anisodus tanguticus]|uniref:HMA domain-containing protein n=1 Tax=Anisodus tanguticus TaxID=243964 RepID=A0AAE1RQ53_9SOLA|nr:hypothetical protein RND71_025391 [Anisodus tanguticus]
MRIEENGTVCKVTMSGKIEKTVKLISPKLDKEETEIEQKHKCKEHSVTTAKLKSVLCSWRILHLAHFSQMRKALYLLILNLLICSISEQPPLTTAVFKLTLNCDACNEKIHRIITRTRGCRNVKMDLVTVTGTIDVKSLAESLRYYLRKDVEVLTEKDGGGGGVYPPDFEYVYRRSTRCRSVSGDYFYHATEVFSDENPNAYTVDCSVNNFGKCKKLLEQF